jgi:hypothetical protein
METNKFGAVGKGRVVCSPQLWSREFMWTNTFVNTCFLALLCLLQLNALVMIRRMEYSSFSSGMIIFLLASVAEFCVVLQPPGLMVWIPFWNNSFGRGFVLCVLSVMAMNGMFILGVTALCGSIATMCSPICSGSFQVPPPYLCYDEMFGGGRTTVYDTIPESP